MDKLNAWLRQFEVLLRPFYQFPHGFKTLEVGPLANYEASHKMRLERKQKSPSNLETQETTDALKQGL